jgi:hypothetical protein
VEKVRQELNVNAWATTGAILWGAYLFLAPLFAMGNVNFFWFSNQGFELLASLYPGLTASISGAILGLFYGAVCGAVCGWLFSGVHNWALKRSK